MLNDIKHRQDSSFWESPRIESPFLPFDEPNSCNDCIFMNQKYNDWLCFHNQVDSNTNLFADVLLKRVVVQPIGKTKECRPTHKIEDNNEQKEITPKKQEIQECEYATT